MTEVTVVELIEQLSLVGEPDAEVWLETPGVSSYPGDLSYRELDRVSVPVRGRVVLLIPGTEVE